MQQLLWIICQKGLSQGEQGLLEFCTFQMKATQHTFIMFSEWRTNVKQSPDSICPQSEQAETSSQCWLILKLFSQMYLPVKCSDFSVRRMKDQQAQPHHAPPTHTLRSKPMSMRCCFNPFGLWGNSGEYLGQMDIQLKPWPQHWAT